MVKPTPATKDKPPTHVHVDLRSPRVPADVQDAFATERFVTLFEVAQRRSPPVAFDLLEVSTASTQDMRLFAAAALLGSAPVIDAAHPGFAAKLRTLHHRLSVTRRPGRAETTGDRERTPADAARWILAALGDDRQWRERRGAARLARDITGLAVQLCGYVSGREGGDMTVAERTFWSNSIEGLAISKIERQIAQRGRQQLLATLTDRPGLAGDA
ncbi:hypothetical protein [Deinococcus soli (ex Cha et al. 2016)]|uniref:Uncharacterized protein n=2 Tax=Deinococcus soli (ex Cha et al. 2016) TaxID=1309411 RepID=A0AAE3XEL1_9DEIO|nr:hypothetical protein [Deinococcus soli (ex Cha et al. 2016)]MDR6218293.1 hypothetical protein [Deinococcus soli (ex Cha et al. 2016)]MDR6329033.1 hypothetical protein [Deinococcus soli (ex Cha et al. 2016)]MDR6751306.1 hypothetical protein [Deinococcus soli (ex Cha et al. 2016)]